MSFIGGAEYQVDTMFSSYRARERPDENFSRRNRIALNESLDSPFEPSRLAGPRASDNSDDA